MQEDHNNISKLLRLKRFEQPPPEYFEKFLREFQERQRCQLLREPAWRIAWDRLCAFFGEQLPARVGYGLASAGVLAAAAVISVNILETRPLAEVASAPAQAASQVAVAQPPSMNLNSQVQLPVLPTLDSRAAQTASYAPPRYVMDARPVSYEPPSSF